MHIKKRPAETTVKEEGKKKEEENHQTLP